MYLLHTYLSQCCHPCSLCIFLYFCTVDACTLHTLTGVLAYWMHPVTWTRCTFNGRCSITAHTQYSVLVHGGVGLEVGSYMWHELVFLWSISWSIVCHTEVFDVRRWVAIGTWDSFKSGFKHTNLTLMFRFCMFVHVLITRIIMYKL